METRVGQGSETKLSERGNDDVDEYREAVRKSIQAEVKNVIDAEMRKASQELLDEQRKAITQMVEEHKNAIREAVEEEKKLIWARVGELRKSISKLGLG